MHSKESGVSSSLMVGHVRHRRLSPVTHELTYPLFMPAIDLDQWPELQKKVWGLGEKWWHWARFRRQDYLGQGDLKAAVQEKVHELTGQHIDGKVLAVVHLRYLGLYFSPVNFYYLYDQQGEWCYLLAEVSNTPWNERHYYALPAEAGVDNQYWQHAKAFHVSPFNPIEQQYVWKLKPLNQGLMVHLECHRQHKEFDATLTLKAQPFTSAQLLKLLIKTPIMTIKVMVGIYWHALKLWMKGAPFYAHPGSSSLNKNNKEKR